MSRAVVSQKMINQKMFVTSSVVGMGGRVPPLGYGSTNYLISRALTVLCFTAFFSQAIAGDIPDLVEKVEQSIVVLIAEPGSGKKGSIGSGIILNEGEVVVTNSHVVRNARRVTIRFYDGSEETASDYVAADEERDLVVIKLKTPRAVDDLQLKDLSNIRVGQKVIAIGTPKGFSRTVSEGIISGIREFQEGTSVYQTTAPLSGGSSGGGLFDLDGSLIGITSFGYKEGQNLNFAYPVDYVAPLLISGVSKSFFQLAEPWYEEKAEKVAIVWVTNSGKKYHRSSCRYLRKSRIPIDFASASSTGYGPCSVCKPY